VKYTLKINYHNQPANANPSLPCSYSLLILRKRLQKTCPEYHRGIQKFSNIFKYFRIFSNVSHHFSNIFEYFQTFSNVFKRFYFAHLA